MKKTELTIQDLEERMLHYLTCLDDVQEMQDYLVEVHTVAMANLDDYDRKKASDHYLYCFTQLLDMLKLAKKREELRRAERKPAA